MGRFLDLYISSARDRDRGSEDPFVTLTLKQPQMSRVSGRTKVDGALEAGRATLRLEIVKEVDCSALYSCDVKKTDSQGSEFVQINRSQQRSYQIQDQSGGSVMTSGEILQQLTLLQQQMTFMVAPLDGKLGDMEARLDGKLGVLQTNLYAVSKYFLRRKRTH